MKGGADGPSEAAGGRGGDSPADQAGGDRSLASRLRGDLSLTSRTRGDLSLTSRIRGSLLGGALGDALGAPIEFMRWPAIRAKWGARGLTHFEPAYGAIGAIGARGAITDDTQMTLFTVEGLIRAEVRRRHAGSVIRPRSCSTPTSAGCGLRAAAGKRPRRRSGVKRSRSRTDGSRRSASCMPAGRRAIPALERCGAAVVAEGGTGAAAVVARLARMAPGTRRRTTRRVAAVSCAPRRSDSFSEVRAASGKDGPAEAFAMSVEIAALTHGHPTGQLPAGVLAAVVHGVAFEGGTLDEALDVATGVLRRQPHHQETLAALEKARRLVLAGEPSVERVESLGEGWVAEEALAIAVYAALSLPGRSARRAGAGGQSLGRQRFDGGDLRQSPRCGAGGGGAAGGLAGGARGARGRSRSSRTISRGSSRGGRRSSGETCRGRPRPMPGGSGIRGGEGRRGGVGCEETGTAPISRGRE